MTTAPQPAHCCHLDWGRRGSRRAAARGDIIVVVDTLSFSSTVVTALQHGVKIYPCSEDERPAEVAARLGAQPAVRRQEAPLRGRFSLSPMSYIGPYAGARVVLSSPNGATCSRYARQAPYLFVAALLNAGAVSRVLNHLLETTDRSISVVACGERLPEADEDGALRMAIEDFLGAGAIISNLNAHKSPDAAICESAYLGSRERLSELVWDCESGRELRERGFADDVRHAAQLDRYDVVPVLRDDWLSPFESVGEQGQRHRLAQRQSEELEPPQ